VGAVAAVVPATEHRYHIPFAIGGLRIIAVVTAVDRATAGKALIAVAIPANPESIPLWLSRGMFDATSKAQAIIYHPYLVVVVAYQKVFCLDTNQT
jgi:hypothetical protein